MTGRYSPLPTSARGPGAGGCGTRSSWPAACSSRQRIRGPTRFRHPCGRRPVSAPWLRVIAVTHYSRLCKIVIDVPQEVHSEELAFWQGATGQEMVQAFRYPEYHGADLPGQEIGLLVQRIGGGQSRVHVDIHTDDLEAEVGRLETLGAKREFQAHAWWVMSEPAGLFVCVIPAEQGHL